MTSVGASSSRKSDSAQFETPTSATASASTTSRDGADMFSALLALLTGASEYLNPGHALQDLKKKKSETSTTATLALPAPILANTPAMMGPALVTAASRLGGASMASATRDGAANAVPPNADVPLMAAAIGKPKEPDVIMQAGQGQLENVANAPTTDQPANHLAYSPPLALTKSIGDGDGASAAPIQTPVTHITPWLKAGDSAISPDDGNGATATAQPNSIKELTPKATPLASASAPPSTIEHLSDILPSHVPKTAAPLAEQLTNPIGAHLDQLRQLGRAEIQLDLHPPELGRVQLHLAMDDGRVNVRMLVQDDAVKRLVDVHLAPLRARIAEMGVSVGQFDVRREGGSSNPNRHYAPEPSLQPIQPARAGPAPARKAHGPLGNSANSVDVIA